MRTVPQRLAQHPVAVIATVTAAALGLTTGPAAASSAAPRSDRSLVIVVSPTGDDAAVGTVRKPIKTLQEAQSRERAGVARGDAVTVELEDGTFSLAAPLVLTAADSGRPDRPVQWVAVRGAQPVVSGGVNVTGWSLHDAANGIWSASVPVGQDSRQLYIDGAAAPRAAVSISRAAATITTTGLTSTDPVVASLAADPEQSRIEVESQDSFTDRYDPVDHVDGSTLVMQQPGWQNNNWGYDTLAHPFAGGQLLLENAYSLLQPGQWYLDPAAGQLYYRAPSGQSPVGHSIVLPQLQSLVQVAGSYQRLVHDITFTGIQFSYSTWLRPGTNIGYADQQNGAFIPSAFPQPADYLSSCQVGCPQFEGARNSWDQVPAAVQVAAATRLTFDNDTFAHLGQVGLGLGNDADANSSGIGLGVSAITVHHDLFTDLAGAGVVVGGVQPDAHHPSVPQMAIKNVTIDNNLVTDVAKDYKEMSGILSTYAAHTVIAHNEVSNLAYDGIDIGWGWGSNDPGGSQDYANRGLYNYQPIYNTPTTLKDNEVTDNLVHGTKKVFHDGGSIYNLSANPGTTISGNYIYDNMNTVGLYLDEGSRYVTLTKNVVQDSGVWAFTNASSTNNTDDSVFQDNWYNAGITRVVTAAPHNNQLINNVTVTGTDWPAGARRVIRQSGVRAGLRYFPIAGQAAFRASTPSA